MHKYQELMYVLVMHLSLRYSPFQSSAALGNQIKKLWKSLSVRDSTSSDNKHFLSSVIEDGCSYAAVVPFSLSVNRIFSLDLFDSSLDQSFITQLPLYQDVSANAGPSFSTSFLTSRITQLLITTMPPSFCSVRVRTERPD